MQIPTDQVTQIVTHWPVARLATVGKGNIPHQVPLVTVYLDGRFWSAVDGKPKRGSNLQRIRNAIANPKGSLLFDYYENDWKRLWWIRAQVELSVVRLDSLDAETARTVKLALERKYPQYSDTPVFYDPPTLLSMHPVSFHSWSAAGLNVRVDSAGQITFQD